MRLLIEVEAHDIVMGTLKEGLSDSTKVTIVPESMFPGFVVDVVKVEEVS